MSTYAFYKQVFKVCMILGEKNYTIQENIACSVAFLNKRFCASAKIKEINLITISRKQHCTKDKRIVFHEFIITRSSCHRAKKIIWCGTHITFYYPALQKKKFYYQYWFESTNHRAGYLIRRLIRQVNKGHSMF